MWNKETNETRYLIETILIQPNEVPLWSYHRERMLQSQQQLGWPNLHHFLEFVFSQIQEKASTTDKKIILRLAWFFNGYSYQYQWSQRNFIKNSKQYEVGLSYAYFDLKSPFSNLKHSYRKRFYFNPETNKAFNDRLFINQNGLLVESSIGNIFIQQKGGWLTPSLSSGCVNGVFRRYFLKNNIVKESELTIEDLLLANEIYLGNAIRGLWRCTTPLSNLLNY